MAGTTIITFPDGAIRHDSLAAPPRLPWIVSPAFDLLFLVNAWWLTAFLPGFLSAEQTPHIEFWQIYFLTTPHRWITLFLVATDPDRRAGRKWLFASIAIVGLLVVGAAWVGTGGFLCLLLVDYVWNSWHFAAQHAGILRHVLAQNGPGRPWFETWGLHSIVFYTSLRLAGWSTGWTENWPAAKTGLMLLDAVMTLPVLALMVVELAAAVGARGKSRVLGERVDFISGTARGDRIRWNDLGTLADCRSRGISCRRVPSRSDALRTTPPYARIGRAVPRDGAGRGD